jgi:ribosomal protein L11 methyltransferase
MDYIELSCNIESHALELTREMLTQELAEIGYESFVETALGMFAYIAARDFNAESLSQITFFGDLSLGAVVFDWKVIKDQNWNKAWEKNFSPVMIDNQCYIRATFHDPKPDVKYEIIIDPKMSFGTGHHETTSLMAGKMLSMNFLGKKVLDMGCGTGILAILASKLGAHAVDAIDLDEWAYQNCIENCKLNAISNIQIICGDRHAIPHKGYDIVLANINRNILLQDMDAYAKHILPDGMLVISGIYSSDLPMVKASAESNAFAFIDHIDKNNWTLASFQKK